MKDEKFSMTKRCFRRTVKYSYFVPIQALWLTFTRPGGYLKHLRGLYRIGCWNLSNHR